MICPLTYGRMGNFLFQAACAASYAWRHGQEFTLPNTTKDPVNNPIYLQHLVNPHFDPHLPRVEVVEKGHEYQDIPFEKSWANCNVFLDGYWQSEKYFKPYRERLLDTFGYEWKTLSGHVSVHIRRGDYLVLTKKHPPVTAQWIYRAMRQFPGARFVIFSDDLPWCQHVFGKRPDVEIVPKRPEEVDLVHMSWCEHHICSASTFSWWGAWLNRNPNKRVIMPNHWFVPGYKGLQTKDIIPPEWIQLA